MRYCEKCGKEIADEAVICPHCGCSTAQQPPANFVPKRAKNARVFGILSLLLLAPLGIPAIILANKSKEETGGVMCGAAKAGMTCGIIGLAWWGLSLLYMLAL